MATLCTTRCNIQSAGVGAKYSEVCPTSFPLNVKCSRVRARNVPVARLAHRDPAFPVFVTLSV